MDAPCDNHYEVSSFLKGHQNAQICVKCEVKWKQHFVMLIHKEHWISLTCISRHKWRGPQCAGAFVIPFRVLNVLCMNSYLVTLRGEKISSHACKNGILVLLWDSFQNFCPASPSFLCCPPRDLSNTQVNLFAFSSQYRQWYRDMMLYVQNVCSQQFLLWSQSWEGCSHIILVQHPNYGKISLAISVIKCQ